jgi:hypothetical protein
MGAVLLLTGVFAGFPASAESLQGPAKDAPELEALSHWVGTWDVVSTTKPNEGQPKESHDKGDATAQWIHDGWFVRQSWTVEPSGGRPGFNGSAIMTYDVRKKVYRSWTFVSNGFTNEAEGAWDAKTRTMTWTTRDPESGLTRITTATFPEDGIEKWTIVGKDREGKVVFETTGKNTRRKK